jgi:chromosomal replication initiation ATPase DnaA
VSSAIATPASSQDRLERFRAARAKLDPAGDPAHAMEQFYVDTPRSVGARIAAELALAPASSHLLVGGVGSGKTTELLATARRIAAIADVATLYVWKSSKLNNGCRAMQYASWAVGMSFRRLWWRAGENSVR